MEGGGGKECWVRLCRKRLLLQLDLRCKGVERGTYMRVRGRTNYVVDGPYVQSRPSSASGLGLVNDLCTGIGLLRGYKSLGKPNNLFFALGLIGRIELEDGIKDGIETQASGTMTVAYS